MHKALLFLAKIYKYLVVKTETYSEEDDVVIIGSLLKLYMLTLF